MDCRSFRPKTKQKYIFSEFISMVCWIIFLLHIFPGIIFRLMQPLVDIKIFITIWIIWRCSWTRWACVIFRVSMRSQRPFSVSFSSPFYSLFPVSIDFSSFIVKFLSNFKLILGCRVRRILVWKLRMNICWTETGRSSGYRTRILKQKLNVEMI